MQADLFYRSTCILAEGPCWHSRRRSLWWTDIEGKSLYEFPWPDGPVRPRPVPRRVSLLVAAADGRLLLGMQGGLALYDPDTEAQTFLCALEPGQPAQRTNDGGCDGTGRIWVGTMDRGCRPGAGSLYAVGADLIPRPVLRGLTIPNGIAWSADQARMYFIDTPTRCVRSYRYDPADGSLADEQVAVRIDPALGAPDGMCLDEEGMLWIALWGGSAVGRFHPQSGTLLDRIHLPVPHVSSCAFAGDDLDQLVITTAREHLDAAALRRYPLSGSLFTARPGVRGRPVAPFQPEKINSV
ncbi:MAG TPA: SMP-30/gluconolactonase/LRE family protein [Chitinophagaceae bacterium]|nr:SMP-30/gluconolactonase/LRE family protein [Chitinophagaceae bacterium]